MPRRTLEGNYGEDPEDPDAANRRYADHLTAQMFRDMGFVLGSMSRHPQRNVSLAATRAGAEAVSYAIGTYPAPLESEN